MKQTPWRLRRPVSPGSEPWRCLRDAWGLSAQAARLAWMRGINTPEELAWRVDPTWSRMLDPYLMSGMAAAVDRIRKAIADQEPICVYGDYDVDGVTATALLVRVLERLGGKVGSFIPNRFNDGYGLNLACIQEQAARMGRGLMISVDCGIRSVAEVEASRELDLEWVITDHHALGVDLPHACAVVHPKLGDYPNSNLAGVGVAFKLAQALLDAVPTPTKELAFLDGLLKLVAIGTIADVVPLAGENALLVKRGLLALAGSNGPGLTELLKAGRVEGTPTAQQLAFGVVPRLNAVGRMGGAEDAVKLLLTRDAGEAKDLAARVEELNTERRAVQQDILDRLPEPTDTAFDLVLDAEAHKGVIGIVAGRRMQANGKPTAICMVADGVVHCSLRAPDGYDLTAMLDLARPFLRSGGGHRSAAGMSFEPSRLTFIRETLNREAENQASNLEAPALSVDGEDPESLPDARSLALLEPFGSGFPEPLVRVSGRLRQDAATFGAGHAKLRLENLGSELVWFSAEDSIRGLAKGCEVDLAISPQDSLRWGRSWLIKAALQTSTESAS